MVQMNKNLFPIMLALCERDEYVDCSRCPLYMFENDNELLCQESFKELSFEEQINVLLQMAKN